MPLRPYLVLCLLPAWAMALPSGAAQQVVINEFMASNSGSVLDASGRDSDWIELYNPTDQAVSLAGWYLSDKLDNPTKWQFPGDRPDLTTLSAGGYLVIRASGRSEVDAELNADFSLDADGEAVMLTAADGHSVVDAIEFEDQISDVAFGRTPDGTDTWRYLYEPTPGRANSDGYVGHVEPVRFSVQRGFYDGPISLTLTTDTPGAQIWYTLNADVPYALNAQGQRTGIQYTEPIRFNGTTCVRAVAVKPDWIDSQVVSHSYLYLDDVITQSVRPTGFPSRWGGNVVDYAMDPRVTLDPVYGPDFKDDLQTIPSVSIVVPNEDFFGSVQGIYANASQRGDAWERAASMEWINPVTGGQFGVNAGLRVHGGVGRSSSVAKHSLRFLFKSAYGPAQLDYPLFPDSDVTSFDSLVLRACWNYSWIGDSTACSGIGTQHTQYMRDAFARDTVRDMGQLTPYGRHVNVYINGLYWGNYILVERPDDGFAALHLGGQKEDYDVLKASNSFSTAGMEVVAGDLDAWTTLFDRVSRLNPALPDEFDQIAQLVDIPNLIDYMLMVFFVGSRDAPTLLCNDQLPRNFYTIHQRREEGRFLFIPWDVEWSLESPTENRVTKIGGQQNPGLIFRELLRNADFKQRVADRIYQHFFHDGVLTVDRAVGRYWIRSEDLARAVVGESARWGDALRSSRPYTRDNEWMTERDRILNDYLSVRTDVVLDQLIAAGWYPQVAPPEFQINGREANGGPVRAGDILSLVDPNPSGTMYYTLDGSDPRAPMTVQDHDSWTLIEENAPKRVFVPTQDIGTQWQGGQEPYDDAAWTQGAPVNQDGTGAVGYERSSGYQFFISYDVESRMYGHTGSCYIRIPFTVPPDDLGRFTTLTLRVRCDDGFVAYLNGREIASINRPNVLTWNATCANRPDSTAFVDISIRDGIDALKPGSNILAVQAINQAFNSSDLLFSAELIAAEEHTALPASQARIYTDPMTVTGDIQLKARVLDHQWSALHEAIFTLDAD